MIPAVLLLLASAAPASPASLEGVAVNAVSGEPLRGVHVRLVRTGAEGPQAVYGAISQEQGRFSMAAVEPGNYVLMPVLRGFVYAVKDPNLALKPGQRMADFRLEMTPRAVIAGRVLDSSGDPVRFAMVEATPVSPGAAIPALRGTMRARTDDRGEYRIRTAPGKYYVKATPRSTAMMGGRQEARADGGPPTTYGETWYPAASSPDRAAVVEVAAGAYAGGIDIRLLELRALSIGGHVRGIPERGTAYVAAFGSDFPATGLALNMQAAPDGAFTIPGLQPGPVRLYAHTGSGATWMQSRALQFDLTSDMAGVELHLTAGGELAGKVVIPRAPPGKRSVRLQPLVSMPMQQPAPAAVDAEGAFEIRGIFPGRYRVHVEGLPENACIERVALDDTAAPDGVLEFSDPPRGGKLTLTATLEGAEVSGAIRDGGGQVLPGVATVYLARDPDDLRPSNMVRTEDGAFTFKGVCPGRYRLVVVAPYRQTVGSTADMRKLAAEAPEFEVKKGERAVTRDVTIHAK
jgi:hypothetical protein